MINVVLFTCNVNSSLKGSYLIYSTSFLFLFSYDMLLRDIDIKMPNIGVWEKFDLHQS